MAACSDYKERQNIRCALREIKGLRLDENTCPTHGLDSIKNRLGSIKNPDFKSSKSEKPVLVSSRRQLRVGVLNECVDRNYTLKKYLEANGDVVDGLKDGLNDNENRVVKPVINRGDKHSFRSYLSVGSLNTNTVKDSPRSVKEGTFRAKKVNITRAKVLDRSDVHDKSTETEEGIVNSSKTDEEEDERVINAELKTAVNVITPTKWKSVENVSGSPKKRSVGTSTLDNDGTDRKSVKNLPLSKHSKLVSNIINHFESCEKSAISGKTKTLGSNNIIKEQDDGKTDISGSFKAERESSLFQPVTDSSSPQCDLIVHKSAFSKVVTSPRKPRKIISYRTAAFTPGSGTTFESSSRKTLQSAPPVVEVHREEPKDPERLERVFEGQCINERPATVVERSESVTERTKHTSEIQKRINETPRYICEKFKSINDRPESTSEKQKGDKERLKNLNEKLKSIVERHEKTKDETANISVDFTMKEPVQSLIVKMEDVKMSPTKEASEYKNGIETSVGNTDDITNDVFKEPLESETSTPRKKVGLSRKNRVDSDERKYLKKYRKKSEENKEKEQEGVNVPKLETVIDTKNAINIQSAKKAAKVGTVRRKLPEIPVKLDSDKDDDESVHQRTLRLLQERKKERRGKLALEKEIADNKAKSKMSPADLKKSLEEKLERSDSKKKAVRVRRELQLLQRENELKAANSRSNSESEEMPVMTNHISVEDEEIMNLTKSGKSVNREVCNDKNYLDNCVQRSKSDVVKRHRTVSETDCMFVSKTAGSCEHSTDTKTREVLNGDNPQTPVEKINLIGSLMQEEAKLQEMVCLYFLLLFLLPAQAG